MDGIEPEAPADRCVACDALLDRNDPVCRACGEVNEPSGAVTAPPPAPELDRLGTWSQLKHEIIDKYSRAYTKVLGAQPFIKKYVYIDGFAGGGGAIDRATNHVIPTTALRVLDVEPPFSEYHLIELNLAKAEHLASVVQNRTNVIVHRGDCNEIIRDVVLPRCRYRDFARGLCVLDPYGLSVSWDLLCAIAEARSVEIIFNFMLMGANRNVFWLNPDRLSERRRLLGDRAWGDRSWRDEVYTKSQANLFGGFTEQKVTNEEFIERYRQRLKTVAKCRR